MDSSTTDRNRQYSLFPVEEKLFHTRTEELSQHIEYAKRDANLMLSKSTESFRRLDRDANLLLMRIYNTTKDVKNKCQKYCLHQATFQDILNATTRSPSTPTSPKKRIDMDIQTNELEILANSLSTYNNNNNNNNRNYNETYSNTKLDDNDTIYPRANLPTYLGHFSNIQSLLLTQTETQTDENKSTNNPNPNHNHNSNTTTNKLHKLDTLSRALKQKLEKKKRNDNNNSSFHLQNKIKMMDQLRDYHHHLPPPVSDNIPASTPEHSIYLSSSTQTDPQIFEQIRIRTQLEKKSATTIQQAWKHYKQRRRDREIMLNDKAWIVSLLSLLLFLDID